MKPLRFASNLWVRCSDLDTVEMVHADRALPLASALYQSFVRLVDGRRSRVELVSAISGVAPERVDAIVERLVWLGFLVESDAARERADGRPHDASGEVPLELANYRILRLIGEGAFGRVYEAFDCERRVSVALKVLRRTTSEGIAGLKREARAISAIASPGLVAGYEVNEAEGLWFLVMELVEGTPFTAAFAGERWSGLPSSSVHEALMQSVRLVAQALQIVHAHGFLHLDIKPSNLLVRADGRPTLLDFGLVRHLMDPSVAGFPLGTERYLAPERVRGERPTTGADWYSLGAVLHDTLSQCSSDGGGGFPSDTLQELRQICSGWLRPDLATRGDGAIALGVSSLPQGYLPKQSGFVGRQYEMQELHAAYDGSRLRSTRVAITGGAGLGKSRLVEEFLNQVLKSDEPPVVVHGRCRPSEPFAFAVFESLPNLPTERSSDAIVSTVLDAVGAGSERRLVIAIDDAQWVDAPSVDVIERILSGMERGVLLLVLGDVGAAAGKAGSAWFSTHARQAGSWLHLRLLPLEGDAALELASGVLGLSGKSPSTLRLAQDSGGIPGLVRAAHDNDNPHRATRAFDSLLDGRLVGRAQELATLERAYETAKRGQTVVCVVRGASGVGKSALLAHFQELVSGPKTLVLRGACQPRARTSFEALDGVAIGLARAIAERSTTDGRPVFSPDVGLIFPELRQYCAPGEPPSSDVGAVRRRVANEFARGLKLVSEDSTPIIVFEDMHWAVEDTAHFLSEMIAAPDSPPSLSVVIAREDATSAALGVVDDFVRRPPFHVAVVDLRVGPLDKQALLALAQTMDSPHSLSRERVAWAAQASGGNPLQFASLILATADETSSDVAASPFESMLQWSLAHLPDIARRYLEVLSLAVVPLSAFRLASIVGHSEDDRPVLHLLRTRRLIRIGGSQARDLVEIYHDRFREVVADALSDERRRAIHLAFVQHLSLSEEASPSALAWHYRQAGRSRQAREYAVRAADGALSTMAFEHAANHLAFACECTTDPDESLELGIRQAECLTSSGRSLDAGRVLLDLAGRISGRRALHVRSRGIEQLLLAGDFAAGLSELKALAKVVNLRFPTGTFSAVVGALGRLSFAWIRVRLRGSSFGQPEEIAPQAPHHQVAASAFRGLVPVDPGLAAYFAVRELGFALDSGNVRRVAMCLAWVGSAVLGPGPVLMNRMGQGLVRHARAMAEKIGDAELHGWVHIATASLAFWSGHWRAVVEEVDAGFALLKQQPVLAHERNIARVIAMRSLEEQGRWTDVARESDEMHREALARGDRYAEVSACLYCAFVRLVADDGAAARRWVHHGLGRWSGGEWSVQNVYGLRVLLYADLLEDKAESAWEQVTKAWRELGRNMHLAIRTSCIDFELLRGRIALRCADKNPGSRTVFAAEALRSAGKLEATKRADAACHAKLLRTAVASDSRSGPREIRESLLKLAHEYADLGMHTYAATVRMRAAEIGQDRGGVSGALEALRAQGIRNPATWTRVYAPGFGLD